MLSGIFYSKKNIRKRVLRLLVPFIFFFLLALATKTILQVLGHHLVQWNLLIEPLRGSCPYRVNPPLWFLQALISLTLLGSLLVRIPNKVIMLFISLVLGTIGYYIGTTLGRNDFYFSSVLLTLPFFMGGWVMRSELLKTKTPWGYIFFLLMSILIFEATKSGVLVNVSLARIPCGYLSFLIIASLASYSLIGLCKYIDKIPYFSSAIRFYGMNSLTVLCTHMIIIFAPYFVTNHIQSLAFSLIITFTFLILTEIPIIYFTNKYLHRIIGK